MGQLLPGPLHSLISPVNCNQKYSLNYPLYLVNERHKCSPNWLPGSSGGPCLQKAWAPEVLVSLSQFPAARAVQKWQSGRPPRDTFLVGKAETSGPPIVGWRLRTSSSSFDAVESTGGNMQRIRKLVRQSTKLLLRALRGLALPYVI